MDARARAKTHAHTRAQTHSRTEKQQKKSTRISQLQDQVAATATNEAAKDSEPSYCAEEMQ